MEDGLADEPQEVVHARPEHGHGGQGGVAVGPEVGHVAQDVAEAQDKAAGDDCGNERCEDFGDGAHQALQRVALLGGDGLCLVLGDAGDARDRDELIVEVVNLVADDDLELASLREAALGRLQGLDGGHVGDAGIDQREAHAGDAVRESGNVLLAAHEAQHLARIGLKLTHSCLSLPSWSCWRRRHRQRTDSFT